MYAELRTRHSLTMYFATFTGSDYEALEPIVELELAKHAMVMVTSVADRQESEDEKRRRGSLVCGRLMDGMWDGCHRCR